jgi:hypothetical protein
MKGLIIILLLVIFTTTISAQRKSPLTQEQLKLAFVKAKNLKRTGAVITITGCVLDVTGLALLATSPVNGTTTGIFYRERETYAWRGGGVLLTGLVLSFGGIPPWIIGGVKKMHAGNKLAGFKVSASLNGAGLKINF